MIQLARILLTGALVLLHPAQTALAQVPKDIEDFLAVSRSIQDSEPVYKGSDFEKGQQAYNSLRRKTAFGFFEKAARGGHGEAQFYLGMMYQEGDGVDQNSEEALKWLRQAARKKVADAENFLGVMYADGDGVAEDLPEAARWFRLAADRGHPAAQENLGALYMQGRGAPKDEREGARLFRLAAEQDATSAQITLAELYLAGLGVSKDPVQAAKWFILAGEAGELDVFDYLDSLIEDGALSEADVEKGADEADAWRASRER